MQYFFRNLHVFVFAVVSVLAGVWVASNSDKSVQFARPLVTDTVELKDLAVAVYRNVSQLDWEEVTDEAVLLFVTTMRMPTLLFERLEDKLEDVERDMDRARRSSALNGNGEDLSVETTGLPNRERQNDPPISYQDI